MSKLKSFYIILSESNLVIEHHQGTLNVDSYIKFKKQLLEDPLFKTNMNYYIHLKDVFFSTTKPDIKKYIKYMASIYDIIGNRKLALVTSTPNQVVPITIYKSLEGDLNQESKIFSTTEMALHWLNIDDESIESIINTISEYK
ncbi:hypothetical protein [Lutibacter flavus]|uniref:SpoIIAA-like n=1 Tax=Lutibacter flavus TaxID=691689 RepID=A0A238VTF2_9FLAO|nr:hypothetical protein [Lutibacter flavus]SNR37620.1 hypothetical protein SAMN04488111_1022 [Lutibacter flavus]